MIKLIATGIWVCAITLASVYFSMKMAAAPSAEDDAAALRAQQEQVPGRVVTLPVISDGEMKGYFLTNISYTANKEALAKITLPVSEILTDELYTLLVGNNLIDITKAKSFDLEEFRKTVKEGMNRRLGGDVITDVLIEQIDYLAKSDIHPNKISRKSTLVSGESPEGQKPAEAGAHGG